VRIFEAGAEFGIVRSELNFEMIFLNVGGAVTEAFGIDRFGRGLGEERRDGEESCEK
jgi:hypothetical protein